MDEIWSTTSSWEARLRTEAQESVESIVQLKDKYNEEMLRFAQSVTQEINGIFDEFNNEFLPRELKRVDGIEEHLSVFIKETVPSRIEAQSGEVSRQVSSTADILTCIFNLFLILYLIKILAQTGI